MLYSKNNGYPQPLPFRIALPDGRTRTDPTTFTAEELALAGYVAAPDAPAVTDAQNVHWSLETGAWVVVDKTPEQIQDERDYAMALLREERNRRLALSDWVVTKAVEENARDNFGIQIPVVWLTYRQDLRDLPANTPDPFNPVWPIPPG